MDSNGTNNNSNNNQTVNTNSANNNLGENTAISAQKSLKDHMAENENNNKPKVNIMNIFIYILMIIIVIICAVLLLHFCDSSKLKEQKTTKLMTTTVNFDGPSTTLPSAQANYQTTTTIATKATHLVVPNGNGANSYYDTTQVKTTSTEYFTRKPISSTRNTYAPTRRTNVTTSTSITVNRNAE